jgi:short-subunit dehydrogenase
MLLLKRLKRRKGKPEFRPVVLVTGCSSGIGLELVRLLCKDPHYRVVITAREKSLPQLEAEFTTNERVLILPLDVTDPQSRAAVVKQVCRAWQGINILINNAGISYRSAIEHMDETSELHQMATNYLGPIGLIREVLPSMRAIGRGKIINVSSVSGMLAMPTMASYSASKFALEGASEALWYEMRPLGVNVTLIQPGFLRSNSFERVLFSPLASKCYIDGTNIYCDYYKEMGPFVARMMARSLTTPQKVAKLIIKVIQTENPPLRVPATLDAYFFYYLRRLLPRRILHPLLMMALPNSKNWAKAYTRSRRP